MRDSLSAVTNVLVDGSYTGQLCDTERGLSVVAAIAMLITGGIGRLVSCLSGLAQLSDTIFLLWESPENLYDAHNIPSCAGHLDPV